MALLINPKQYETHNNLGNIYKQQSNTNSTTTNTNTSTSNNNSNNIEYAKDCYLEAIKYKPDFAPAWCNLGNIYRDYLQFSTGTYFCISYYYTLTRKLHTSLYTIHLLMFYMHTTLHHTTPTILHTYLYTT